MLNSSKLLSDAFYESPIMELYNRSTNYLSQSIDMIDSCIDRPITICNTLFKWVCLLQALLPVKLPTP